MQRIFWIGSAFFQSSLNTYGFEVFHFNFEEATTFTWQDLVNKAGYEPDIVVVADKSRPPFVLGVENFPCLTVFYAVDTHIHSWYSLYAQAFDLCLVSLHDHLDFFKNKRLKNEHILWSPPFARDTDAPTPNTKPEWDCLFVGTVNNQTLPKRSKFLQEINKHTSVHITRGNYGELYPKARVILNQCEGDDLNFRVFEALGCGGCLVTPDIGHGLQKLFQNGHELITYDSHNAKHAADCIKNILNNEALRLKISEQGLECVNTKHRATHRAQAFSNFLQTIDINACVEARLKNAKHIRKIWLRQIYLLLAEAMENEHLRKAYVQAARNNIE